DEGVLYYMAPTVWGRRHGSINKRLVVPRDLKATIMHAYHDDKLSGHMGYTRTYARIVNKYYWEDMVKDIRNWVNSCYKCASRKKNNRVKYGLLKPIVVEYHWEMVGMDICGPITTSKTGHRYILVLTDHFTKWV